MSNVTAWINRYGKVDMCPDKRIRLDYCPSLECRPIVYVDKYATGTGDGSSRANAFTTIQAAINQGCNSEIQIQGYGDTDPYVEQVIIVDCQYLKGIGEMWISGYVSGYNVPAGGNYYASSVKLENINVKGTGYYCFGHISLDNIFLNCASDGGTRGFYYCGGLFDHCTARNCTDGGGFSDTYVYSNLDEEHFNVYESCQAIDCYEGFYRCEHSTINNCIASNCTYEGFRDCEYSDLVDCVSEYNHTGFYLIGYFPQEIELTTMTNCTARYNRYCGFRDLRCTVTNCSDINNCTSESYRCDPNDDNYICEDV